MCRLIESIKVANRQLQNIAYHNIRFNLSRKELFGIDENADLSELLFLPNDLSNQVYKCRFTYSNSLHSIQFLPYTPKLIHTLKLVEADDLDYRYKYQDRSCFMELLTDIAEDDIIIVQKDFVTDTSFSNIVFFDGSNWLTPSTYLLNGTMRRFLLDTKQIIACEIRIEDLKNFESAKLINAMLDLENSEAISINGIVY